MNNQHRTIRALLQTMAPLRAISYIKSFQLRPEEEDTLIACDVRGMSYIQAGDNLHLSPEAIKRRKRAAYQKINDAIRHEESRG